MNNQEPGAAPALRAMNTPVTLGHVAKLEKMFGKEVVNNILRTEQLYIDTQQKVEILTTIFEYTEQEALALGYDIVEAELRFFFTQLLRKSQEGTILSMKALVLSIA